MGHCLLNNVKLRRFRRQPTAARGSTTARVRLINPPLSPGHAGCPIPLLSSSPLGCRAARACPCVVVCVCLLSRVSQSGYPVVRPAAARPPPALGGPGIGEIGWKLGTRVLSFSNAPNRGCCCYNAPELNLGVQHKILDRDISVTRRHRATIACIAPTRGRAQESPIC